MCMGMCNSVTPYVPKRPLYEYPLLPLQRVSCSESERIMELSRRLEELEPSKVWSAAVSAAGDLDWFFDYHELDLTIGCGVEEYQVLRMVTASVCSDNYVWYDDNGNEYEGDEAALNQYIEEHGISNPDDMETCGVYKVDNHGEFMQYWINLNTLEVHVLGKLCGDDFNSEDGDWEFLSFESTERYLCGCPHEDQSQSTLMLSLYGVNELVIAGCNESEFYEYYERTYIDFLHKVKAIANDPVMVVGGFKLYKLLSHRFSVTDEDRAKWNIAVKIAFRYHYVPTDMTLWFDMMAALIWLDKDVHNPKLVCPSDLKSSHDKWCHLYARKMEEQMRMQRIKEAKKHKESFESFINPYLHIHISTDKFDIYPCQNVEMLIEESIKMHNCLSGYANVNIHKNSLILFVRDKFNARIADVELNLSTWHIVQTQAVCNTMPCFNGEPCRDEINAIIRDNIKLFMLAKSRNSRVIEMKPNVATTATVAVAA